MERSSALERLLREFGMSKRRARRLDVLLDAHLVDVGGSDWLAGAILQYRRPLLPSGQNELEQAEHVQRLAAHAAFHHQWEELDDSSLFD